MSSSFGVVGRVLQFVLKVVKGRKRHGHVHSRKFASQGASSFPVAFLQPLPSLHDNHITFLKTRPASSVYRTARILVFLRKVIGSSGPVSQRFYNDCPLVSFSSALLSTVSAVLQCHRSIPSFAAFTVLKHPPRLFCSASAYVALPTTHHCIALIVLYKVWPASFTSYHHPITSITRTVSIGL